jgi:hypothetical protein
MALRRDPPEGLMVNHAPSSFFGRVMSALRGTDVFAEQKASEEGTEPTGEADGDAPAFPETQYQQRSETVRPTPALFVGQETPRYVLRDSTEADAVLRRLVRKGWLARSGFSLPDPAWDVTGSRLVLHGPVVDVDDLQLAVLAAARGAAVVAVVDGTAPFRQSLIDDLRRLGAVY